MATSDCHIFQDKLATLSCSQFHSQLVEQPKWHFAPLYFDLAEVSFLQKVFVDMFAIKFVIRRQWSTIVRNLDNLLTSVIGHDKA